MKTVGDDAVEIKDNSFIIFHGFTIVVFCSRVKDRARLRIITLCGVFIFYNTVTEIGRRRVVASDLSVTKILAASICF
jgi:hypothetical protein